MKTVEVLITGRVQKIGFRACIRRIALDLNVSGTVANLPDGRVTIHATAEAMVLEKFISMVYSCPRAVVRDVRIRDVPHCAFESFTIIKTETPFSREY
jgi:acylphosphatase